MRAGSGALETWSDDARYALSFLHGFARERSTRCSRWPNRPRPEVKGGRRSEKRGGQTKALSSRIAGHSPPSAIPGVPGNSENVGPPCDPAADNSGNLCLQLTRVLRACHGPYREGVGAAGNPSVARDYFSRVLAPCRSVPVGKGTRVGARFRPRDTTGNSENRCPIPVKLSMPEIRRVFASGPKRFPSTPPLKCYSSCYSLIRVLGTFRVG